MPEIVGVCPLMRSVCLPLIDVRLLCQTVFFVSFFFFLIINIPLLTHESYGEFYISNTKISSISQGVDEINLMIKHIHLLIIHCIFINLMISLTSQIPKILGFHKELTK